MVVAKTLQAHTDLVMQLQARTVRREYEAVVSGIVIAGGTVDQPIGRHAKQRTKMAVISDGKEARTHYKVLERFDGHSHLRLKLETGRTHQIRVHYKHLGYPLFGDAIYGKRSSSKLSLSIQFEPARQLLHAWKLSFQHPGTKESLTLTAPLPEDFRQALRHLASITDVSVQDWLPA